MTSDLLLFWRCAVCVSRADSDSGTFSEIVSMTASWVIPLGQSDNTVPAQRKVHFCVRIFRRRRAWIYASSALPSSPCKDLFSGKRASTENVLEELKE